ncbi:DNA-3-methyladenine glycosylase II [Agromyces sp. CF514]|uniref:AlkA N-terminal domain-containing protein n=1 Tax=Agromyces sp. CF514 TaxID=1881031 RepID=UPI0008E3622A|nr:AlkA N-terminal domain-containing protein [Agromyces sp. CF514]SFR88020.1 DNA-3-methyladenine glycosylase II [Agromyces sp. CF514]
MSATAVTPHPLSETAVDDPDFAERYRAMQARDARFDGQFITGVHSTGIYCRPSCPAVAPKPSNVTFYLTAAAAHEAGLRACKRCLPDAVPGSPEWNLRDDLAARAMRLIADGVVERDGVPGLAARLGYTPRHLTRVLTAELGAGPLALARAHRAQTARSLLTSTSLPVADVAFASGFGSIRQFNDTIREVYERSPLEVRASARVHERGGGRSRAVDRGRPGPADLTPTTEVAVDIDPGVVRLRLPARPPFDAAGVFGWLAARTVAGVEQVSTTPDGSPRFRRTLQLPGGPALVGFTPGGDAQSPSIEVEARLTGLSDLPPLVARVRRLFDLDADALAIDTALSAEPAFADAVAAVPGIRVPGCLDPHELVFRALIGQQISVAAARTALGRLAAELGERLAGDDELHTLFPTAAAIAQRGGEVLRGPAARIRTIVDVAARLASGDLVVSSDRERHDLEARLLEIPGIGPWTAGYVAMRVTGAPDVLLTGDLALRNGAANLGLPRDARELARFGARWAPWRSYASMHLWRAS